MSRTARVACAIVILVALALAGVVFVADIVGGDPSTTGVLVFAPALILGISVVGIIAVVDYIVQQLRKR